MHGEREDRFSFGETWVDSMGFEWVVTRVDPTVYFPTDIGRPGVAFLKCDELGEEWPRRLRDTIDYRLIKAAE